MARIILLFVLALLPNFFSNPFNFHPILSCALFITPLAFPHSYSLVSSGNYIAIITVITSTQRIFCSPWSPFSSWRKFFQFCRTIYSSQEGSQATWNTCTWSVRSNTTTGCHSWMCFTNVAMAKGCGPLRRDILINMGLLFELVRSRLAYALCHST